LLLLELDELELEELELLDELLEELELK